LSASGGVGYGKNDGVSAGASADGGGWFR